MRKGAGLKGPAPFRFWERLRISQSSLREAWGGGPAAKRTVEGPQPRSGEDGIFPSTRPLRALVPLPI